MATPLIEGSKRWCWHVQGPGLTFYYSRICHCHWSPWFVLSRCPISQILLLSGIGLLSLREWVEVIRCPSSILISRGSALNCGKGGKRSQRLFIEKPGWRQGRNGLYVRQFLWVGGGGWSLNQSGRAWSLQKVRGKARTPLDWPVVFGALCFPTFQPTTQYLLCLLVPISLTLSYASHVFFCN